MLVTKPAKLVIERAGPHQVEDVLDILDEAAAWLATQEIVQWPASFRCPLDTDVQHDHVSELRQAAADGQLWTLRDAHRALGTITITNRADPEFAHGWPGGPGGALYLHKGAVRREAAGQGARALQETVEQEAALVGARKIRLDCAKRNPRLHEYYRSHGFRLVGLVDLPHRLSGALFERLL